MKATGNNGIFSTLYCTRIRLFKGETPIVNLSLLFCLIALLVAPWLVIGGAIVALALGYRFTTANSSEDFDGSFRDVIHNAKANVRNAMGGAASNDPQA